MYSRASFTNRTWNLNAAWNLRQGGIIYFVFCRSKNWVKNHDCSQDFVNEKCNSWKERRAILSLRFVFGSGLIHSPNENNFCFCRIRSSISWRMMCKANIGAKSLRLALHMFFLLRKVFFIWFRYDLYCQRKLLIPIPFFQDLSSWSFTVLTSKVLAITKSSTTRHFRWWYLNNIFVHKLASIRYVTKNSWHVWWAILLIL